MRFFVFSLTETSDSLVIDGSVYTEHLTACTFFSVLASPRQFVSLRRLTCGSRLSQGSSFFYDRLVLRTPTKFFHPHMSLLGVPALSTYFFDSTTILDPFSRDADWKQIKPPYTPPRGWTVWPSGCTTSYHNMQSQRWVSSVWTLIWRDKHWKAHSRAHKSLDAEESRLDLCVGVSLACSETEQSGAL